MKSETITKIADALCKAQKGFKNAIKDSENPYFNSKYADLTSVFDACRDELAANGLSITQPLSSTPEGKPVVNTFLLHTSGEWISSSIVMNPVKQDPQGMGSAITYGRRYSLESILGIAREEADDDGNAASTPPKPKPTLAPGAPPPVAGKGGAVPQQPPLPSTPPKEGEWDINASLSHLGSLVTTYSDMANCTEGDALQTFTKTEKFRGFKDIFKLKHEWQFKGAIEKGEALIRELSDMDADGLG